MSLSVVVHPRRTISPQLLPSLSLSFLEKYTLGLLLALTFVWSPVHPPVSTLLRKMRGISTAGSKVLVLRPFQYQSIAYLIPFGILRWYIKHITVCGHFYCVIVIFDDLLLCFGYCGSL